MLFISCKRDDSYPVYDLTPEERNWLVYNVGDTLVFYDSLGNGDLLRVAERKEELVEIRDLQFKSKPIISKQFMSSMKITPLRNSFFQKDLILHYDKVESGILIVIESQDNFRNTLYIDNAILKDTTVRDSIFRNCILVKNEDGLISDSSFKSIVYSKEKGIVAFTNYKNKTLVIGKWK